MNFDLYLILLKLVSKGPINNIPALVLIMAWHQPGEKPLSEPMKVSLVTHIYAIRSQWIKYNYVCTPQWHAPPCVSKESSVYEVTSKMLAILQSGDVITVRYNMLLCWQLLIVPIYKVIIMFTDHHIQVVPSDCMNVQSQVFTDLILSAVVVNRICPAH